MSDILRMDKQEINPELLKIFDEQIARKPNWYPWTDEFIEAMHNGFWTDKEFDFISDIQDFMTKCTPEERDIIVKTLSAIGQIEIAVKTFWLKLGENLPQPCFVDLGIVMANTEVIHNNAYERLLSIMGLNDVFEDNLKLDIIKGRVNYLRKYLQKCYKDSKKQYIYALILFTLFIENVSLFSQFYIVRWFGRFRNMFKDANQQVKYTRLEENIHAQVGIRIINTAREQYPELFDEELETKVLEEAQAAFDAESKIIDWILGPYQDSFINTDEEGEQESYAISADVLKEYIKNRINDSLKQIKFKKLFTINRELKKDFRWMDKEVLANTSTDFFWQRPVEYSKKDKAFTVDELFPDKVYIPTW